MPTKEEVVDLLTKLDAVCADELESQTLDFKEWDRQGIKGAIALIVETVICLANGGGGTLVVGVQDRTVGRAKAILGVPDSIDVNQLKRAIYDKTDPKLTPTIDELRVPEGTGRLLIIQVYGDLPPYTDTQGYAKMRVGKDCVPLTGSKRAEIMTASGDSDVTAEEVEGAIDILLSPAGLEAVREVAGKQNAPVELLNKSNTDLLRSIDLLSERGRLRKAAVLLAGKPEHIRRLFPGYAWSFLRMRTSTDYNNQDRGHDSLAVAISRFEELILPHNPLTTVEQGLLHLEFRKYPTIALREGLMNAFAHADYRINGVIQVKLFDDRLEIANPGGLIGGISVDNILRHAPIARNPTLMNALISLNLVNRNNLGVQRMYQAMLQDGKEPPVIRDEGNAVRVTFLGSEYSVPFRAFVESTMRSGLRLTLEHLLVLNYLVRHGEIDGPTAATICQQHEREIRESLRVLVAREVLDVRRRGAATVWQLSTATIRALRDVRSAPSEAPQSKFEAAQSQVLAWLHEAKGMGRLGIPSGELRERLGFSSEEIKYVTKKLKQKNLIESTGRGPNAMWVPIGDE